MRTLKKVLAVVLALAMVLGMAVTASAGYADAAAITDKEAVEVLGDLNVMVGSDKKFNPAGTLTRAEAAVLIANLCEGAAAEDLVAIQMFDDVDSSNWAAKYVAYCATKGIVNGVGNNKFNPTGKLTGTEFALMLLATLGYDAKIELTGANWAAKQVEIINLAKKAGILSAKLAKTATKELTREEAARYCLNALQSTMVEYETKGTTITVGGVEIVSGASKATAVTEDINTKNAWAGKIVGAQETAQGTSIYTVELGEKLYDGKLVLTDESGDDFGRPAVRWDYKGDKVGIYAETPVFTTTKEMTEDEVFTALGAAGKTAKDKTYKYVAIEAVTEDGVALGTWTVTYGRRGGKTFTDVSDVIAKKGNKTVFNYSGNGRLLEFYEGSDENSFKAVVINEYFGTVTEITAANAKKGTDAYAHVGDLKFKTDAFAKKDKVIVTKSYDLATPDTNTTWDSAYVKNLTDEDATIQSMVAATAIKGVVKSYNTAKSTVTVDSTVYDIAYGMNAANFGTATKEQTVYADSYGYLITTPSDTYNDKLVIVTDVYTTLGEKGQVQHTLDGIISDGSEVTWNFDNDVNYVNKGQIYTYVEDDAVYTLTLATGRHNATVAQPYQFMPSAQQSALSAKQYEYTFTGATETAYYMAEDVLFIAVDEDGTLLKENGTHDTLVAQDTAFVVDGNSIVAVMIEGTFESDAESVDKLTFVGEKTGKAKIKVGTKEYNYNTYEAYVDGEAIDDIMVQNSVNITENSFYKSFKYDENDGVKSAVAFKDNNDQSAKLITVKAVNGALLVSDDLIGGTGTSYVTYSGLAMSKVVNLTTGDVDKLADLVDEKVVVLFDTDTNALDWVYVVDAN